MKLKKILYEVLTERKQVGRVYHFTNLLAAGKILQSNLLKASHSTKNISGKTISTTRDKNFSKQRLGDILQISGDDVKFELDGTKLSDRYEVKPYDDAFDVQDQEYDADDKEHFGDEMEEVWFGKALESDSGFRNFKNYILSVIFTKKLQSHLSDPNKLKSKLHGSDKIDVVNMYPFLFDTSLSDDVKLTKLKAVFEKYGVIVKFE
jgi:hypothetical protein